MLISDKAEDGTPVSQLTSGSMRRVRVQCNACGKESSITWSNYLQAQRVRSDRRGSTYCQPCAVRANASARKGVPAPYVAKANRQRTRELHGSWRGGRYIDKSGYVNVLVSPPGGGAGYYRKEHQLVMESHLGRSMRPHEVIHHIDNNKQNNSIDNLFLTDEAGHGLAHVSLVLAFMLLRAAGQAPKREKACAETAWRAFSERKIHFDATQGIYVAHIKLRELLEHPNG